MKMFNVTYQGFDTLGGVIRTISILAEDEYDAEKKVKQISRDVKIYSTQLKDK